MRFLVATDNHCGYGEVKNIAYDDAFTTFEEVLENAKKEKVDFLLLGGDLFHDNNPSRETRIRVMRSLRKYVLNGPPTKLEFCSDPKTTFSHSAFDCVNFKDENLKVALPVFTIHGNHDDLSGTSTTALDVLHEAGLVNLFGRFDNVQKYIVDPVLLRKRLPDGTTENVALYGISSQRDDRLARAFKSGRVIFGKPPEGEKWYCVLVLHQNRPPRSMLRTTGAHIPVTMIPNFIHLVIWGHEHDSIPTAEYVKRKDVGQEDDEKGFWLLQPGSTVATSLTAEEGKQKHCFVIEPGSDGVTPVITPIPLLTVRQLFFEEHNLDDLKLKPPSEDVRLNKGMEDEKFVDQRIKEILAKAKSTYNNKQPEAPLVRIKVTYSNRWRKIPPMSARKVGAPYAGRVANPSTILVVSREREKATNSDSTNNSMTQVNNRARGDEKAAGFIEKLDVMLTNVHDYNATSGKITTMDKQLHQSIRDQITEYEKKLDNAFKDVDGADLANGYQNLQSQLSQYIERGTSNADADESMDINSQESDFSQFQFNSQI